ncbi:hypothetical protein V6N12_023205 [Hibiscus sabdariffa]|uniref:Disease resistance protein At4g27190-like leucine-rich repeats domain-containing protein n=1 Tax=Hibiscus sabdariffa TaxID=183260 RepID=A0ABR2FX14_9ROSI
MLESKRYGPKGQQLSHYFGNLKAVELEIIRSKIFFQSGGGVGLGDKEKPARLLLSQITKLKLYFLFELVHLWKEEEVFPSLRISHMQSFPPFKRNLLPSSESFRNLVTLKVLFCHGIVKLVTHSTAKSLVQLKEMSIRKCQRIEEILEDREDDDHHNEISFPQLNRSEL